MQLILSCCKTDQSFKLCFRLHCALTMKQAGNSSKWRSSYGDERFRNSTRNVLRKLERKSHKKHTSKYLSWKPFAQIERFLRTIARSLLLLNSLSSEKTPKNLNIDSLTFCFCNPKTKLSEFSFLQNSRTRLLLCSFRRKNLVMTCRKAV